MGWDRSGSAGTGGVGIHHPSGDVKKISVYTITPQSTAYDSNSVDSNASHWRIIWNDGTTEGGSSGSPLINSNHHVIGQLHGGYASCSAISQPDWYGKLSVSWTGNGATDSRRRLKDWLDPASTNPATLDGMAKLVISGPSTVYPQDCESIYTLSVPTASSIQWTVSPSTYQSCLTANGTSVTFNKPAISFTDFPYHTLTLTCSFSLTGQSYSISKNFTLYNRIGGGLPTMGVYDGSTQVTSGAAGITSYTLKATENSYLSYYWEVFGPTGGSPILSTNVQSPTIRFPDAGSYAIRLSFRAICGRTLSPPHTTFYFTAIQPFTVYPNPISSGTPLHLGLKDPSQPLTPSSARYAIMSISTGGLIVYPTTFDTNTGCDININSLPAGLYRLIVIYNGADYGVTFQKY